MCDFNKSVVRIARAVAEVGARTRLPRSLSSHVPVSGGLPICASTTHATFPLGLARNALQQICDRDVCPSFVWWVFCSFTCLRTWRSTATQEEVMGCATLNQQRFCGTETDVPCRTAALSTRDVGKPSGIFTMANQTPTPLAALSNICAAQSDFRNRLLSLLSMTIEDDDER